MRHALGLVFLATIFSSCGNIVNCSLYGNNLKGHVLFQNVAPNPNANVVVEYSSNNFSFTEKVIVNNAQGLVSVPYTACAGIGTFNVRAYLDTNNSGTWSAGKACGRDDGTTTGNATYVSRVITAVSSTDSWPTISGVDITLDSTAAQ